VSRACRRLVVYSDAAERGGAERTLGYLIGALEQGIEVTVAGVDEDVVAWLASQRRDAGQVVLPPVAHKLDVGPIARHVRTIGRLRADVLQASLNSPWSCQYGILAGLLAPGTKVIALENAQVPSSQPSQRALKRLLSRRLAAHVAVGESSAREIERLIGLPRGSLLTISNGVPDRPRTNAPTTADPPLIGAISRIGRQKGLELIVRALPELPGVGAILVGEGPALADVRALARTLGVADRLQTPGFDPDPGGWLARLDVFVLPTEAEAALPLSIVEAMLARVPVVATDIASIAESFPDGEVGLLVAPGDLDGLVRALSALLADPRLRERMGARGRELALARFGVERMASDYERLYEEVCASPGRGAAPGARARLLRL
jgi:glycosyltransferase involved in cell wall biosynthesis